MGFLTAWPVWLSCLIAVGVPTLLAMVGPVFVRRHVALDRLTTNNEVAGFKFATVGVLYAVLLAFAVIVVWEKFTEAERTVAREAGAATAIYRLARGLDADSDAAIRDNLTAYLEAVIAEDWPAMGQSRHSRGGTQALNRIYTTLLSARGDDARGQAVLTELLRQLDGVTEARRIRLVIASGSVPPVLWFVLLAGAVLTVCFTFFFGTQNLRAQTMMTGILTALVFAGLYVIVVIDRPFIGAVRVEPEAIAHVLEDFGAPSRH